MAGAPSPEVATVGGGVVDVAGHVDEGHVDVAGGAGVANGVDVAPTFSTRALGAAALPPVAAPAGAPSFAMRENPGAGVGTAAGPPAAPKAKPTAAAVSVVAGLGASRAADVTAGVANIGAAERAGAGSLSAS